MAIEFPNTFHAGANLIGDPEAMEEAGLATPFLANHGFQAFVPGSTGASISGGFTRLGDGEYLMALIEGIEFFEAILYVQQIANIEGVGNGFILPPVLAVLDGLPADSRQILVQTGIITGDGGVDTEDAELFTIQVIRMGTGGDAFEDLIAPIA